MTKMKSKKMTKSTFAIIIMAIAMVAMLAFGGTYAYFTATANQITGTITTGSIKLEAGSTTTVSKDNILPGDTIISAPIQYVSTVTENTAKGAYVAVKVKFSLTAKDETADITKTETLLNTKLSTAILGETGSLRPWAAVSVTNVTDGVVYVYSTDQAKPSAFANNNGEGAAKLVFLESLTFPDVYDNMDEGADNSDADLMNATITISFEARSMQVANAENKTLAEVAAYLFGVGEGDHYEAAPNAPKAE